MQKKIGLSFVHKCILSIFTLFPSKLTTPPPLLPVLPVFICFYFQLFHSNSLN